MSAADLHEHVDSKLLGVNQFDLVGLVGLVNLNRGGRTHLYTQIKLLYDAILKLIVANYPAC